MYELEQQRNKEIEGVELMDMCHAMLTPFCICSGLCICPGWTSTYANDQMTKHNFIAIPPLCLGGCVYDSVIAFFCIAHSQCNTVYVPIR